MFLASAEISDGADRDRITDFTPGTDRSDLTALGNQTLIGGEQCTGVASHVR